MDLTFKQLRALVAVADEGSFTRAGKRLNLSQQSISVLIRDVEARLGTKLFDRTTRSVKTTEAATDFIAEVRTALASIDAAVASVTNAHMSQPLVLAITPAVAYGELYLLLEALGDGTPIDIREVWMDELAPGLIEGRFDAGLSIEAPRTPQFEVTHWRQNRIDLLVSKDHPFASQPSIRLSQLDDTALVIGSDRTNPGLRDRLLDTLAKADVRPRLTEGPQVSGPPPVAVEKGEAASIWLTGMQDRFMPAGVVRVPLYDPETLVTTDLFTAAGRPPRFPKMLEALHRAISRTSNLLPSDAHFDPEINKR